MREDQANNTKKEYVKYTYQQPIAHRVKTPTWPM